MAVNSGKEVRQWLIDNGHPEEEMWQHWPWGRFCEKMNELTGAKVPESSMIYDALDEWAVRIKFCITNVPATIPGLSVNYVEPEPRILFSKVSDPNKWDEAEPDALDGFEGVWRSMHNRVPGKASARDIFDGGTKAERARILAHLASMKPGETPYTRGSSEMLRKAEMRLWERIAQAIEGGKEAKSGADHE